MNQGQAQPLPDNDILVDLVASQAKKLAITRTLIQKRHGGSLAETMNEQLAAIYRELQMIEEAWLAEAATREAKLKPFSKSFPLPQERSTHE